MLKDVVSATLVASFLTVLLPHFSEQVAAKATEELRRSCSFVLRYGALVFFPISVLIGTCIPPVLQHVSIGRLDAEASYSIAMCFAAYGAGLFGEFTALGLYQALVSLKKVRLMVFIGVFCNFVPNILLNLLLIGPLGVAGLALSSALVSYICLAAVYWTLRNLIGVDNEKRNLVFVAGCVASAAAMGGIVLAVLQGVRMIGGEGLWSDLLGTTAGGIGGLFAYGALLLWRSEDARLVWRICRDKVKNMLGFSPDQSEGNQGS
jgi:putative peptidoglycan lipid II flippase